MKWQFTIMVNVLILFGFWLAGFVAVSPAYNHFAQYALTSYVDSMPAVTDMIFSVRLSSLVIPILWLLVSILFMRRLKKRSQIDRVELVQLHTSISVFGGLSIFIVFALAGILPFLKFGGLFE